jgi:hypothetical protein
VVANVGKQLVNGLKKSRWKRGCRIFDRNSIRSTFGFFAGNIIRVCGEGGRVDKSHLVGKTEALSTLSGVGGS